ncbi:GntR family transcriptional regulator YhfZ [Serratia marcescens]|uniref:GntR family transcriptional regulator YhfZ n=1 Tax=Serratia marcescens TaxID=615 RepID=UPI002FDA307D
MSRSQFIKKERLSLSCLAMYLLGCQPGERLKTIGELARDNALSIGLMQAALKTLENAGCITVQRSGRNGSFLTHVDYRSLLDYANISRVVCAMPLPYTREYEGLASGLKREFSDVPFYFAHMRGADIRVECLRNGIYDLAVVSRLAAEEYVSRPENGVKIAATLGEHSWVSHQIIRRRGDHGAVRRVGVDCRSMDQKLLTDMIYDPAAVARVEIPYHDCLSRLENGTIDAVVWNVENRRVLARYGLEAVPLEGDQRVVLATEATILIRSDDRSTGKLLDTFVDTHRVRQHQRAVVSEEIEPSY